VTYITTADTTAPNITDISANETGSFKQDEVITLQVTFSETVNVSGQPFIELNTGGKANYLSGSDSNTLHFQYIVKTGENTASLDCSGGLNLSGEGSIFDSVGNVTSLSLPANSLSGNTNIIIDTTAPQITIGPNLLINNLSSSLAKVDDTITLSFTTDEPIQPPTVTFSCSGANISGHRVTTVSGDGSASWTATYNASGIDLDGPITYLITYSDLAGNPGTINTSGGGVTFDKTVQSGAVCFLGYTKVKTDQGPVAFNKLTTNHSIGGKRIQKVLKVKNSDDNMIFIKKHSLGKGVPNKNTYIGRNHGVYLPDGSFVRARNLITNKGVTEQSRNHDLIYNVLLDIHGKMNVNGMICETLNMNDPSVRRLL